MNLRLSDSEVEAIFWGNAAALSDLSHDIYLDNPKELSV
jgi:hypothetical protein